MPLPIAEYVVENLTCAGDTILDPMCGSGTTLLAARSVGRSYIGSDIDPLAVILSRGAVCSIDTTTLMPYFESITTQAESALRRAASKHTFNVPILKQEEQQFLDYWFPERSQRELSALAEAIQSLPAGEAREFFWTVFSSLIIAKSSGASYALDLSRTRPHKVVRKPVLYPMEGWARRFRKALAGIEKANSVSRSGRCNVVLGDARHLPLKADSVDFVLTSPPYKQAVDYMRAHKFALVWMGYSFEYLRDLRGEMVGSYRGLQSPDGLPTSLEDSLTTTIPIAGQRGHVRRYLSDMKHILAEFHRVLKPGSLAVMVTGPSIVARGRYDALDVFEALASDVGLTICGSVKRRLSQARRTLPPPQKTPGNYLRRRLVSEFLIAMRKPT